MTTTQTIDAPRSRAERATCLAGQRLQAARESAGLTREDLARRVHFAQVDGWYCHVLAEHDCARDLESRYVRDIERMSQRVFDKSSAEFHTVGLTGETWKDMHWGKLMALVEMASPEASDEELGYAWRAHLIERYERVFRESRREITDRLAGLSVDSPDREALRVITSAAIHLELSARRIRKMR